MKTKVLFFSFCCIVLFTQAVRSQSVDLGLKAGLNLANFYGKDSDGDIKAGFVGGIYFKISPSDQFAFQPELLYSQQGIRGSEDGFTVKFKQDYLNIPLMAKFYVAPNFNLQLGPQLGFLINSKLSGGSGGDDVSINSKELFKSADVGLNAGLEFESESGVSVTARYNLGLSNVSDMDDVDSKNSVIQLTLGYSFIK